MTDAVAAEWLKLRTLRSTAGVMIALALFVGLMALFGWYAVHLWQSTAPQSRDRIWVTPLEYLTEPIAQMCLAVLGVLTITAEYSTGAIRTTLTLTPQRSTVLVAKALVVAAVALVAGTTAIFATSLVSRLIVGDRPINGLASTGVGGRLPQLTALSLSVTVFALLGFGLGAVTRSAVAAISVLAAVWYPVPMIVYHLPAPWGERISSLLPGALAGQLVDPIGGSASVYGTWLSPPGAAVAMLGYAVLPIALAGVVINRRNA